MTDSAMRAHQNQLLQQQASASDIQREIHRAIIELSRQYRVCSVSTAGCWSPGAVWLSSLHLTIAWLATLDQIVGPLWSPTCRPSSTTAKPQSTRTGISHCLFIYLSLCRKPMEQRTASYLSLFVFLSILVALCCKPTAQASCLSLTTGCLSANYCWADLGDL